MIFQLDSGLKSPRSLGCSDVTDFVYLEQRLLSCHERLVTYSISLVCFCFYSFNKASIPIAIDRDFFNEEFFYRIRSNDVRRNMFSENLGHNFKFGRFMVTLKAEVLPL